MDKKCCRCKKLKIKDAFCKDKKRKDGLNNTCRECESIRKKVYSNKSEPDDFDLDIVVEETIKNWPNFKSSDITSYEIVITNSLQKVLIIPDCHIPYNDKRAWSLLMAAGRMLKPDIIIVLGDFSDCFCVSDHDKDPNRSRMLDVEVEAVKAHRAELDSLGAKKKIFLGGNHEYRLERYLMTKAPELFNLVKIEELFELKEHGWEYIPYKQSYKLGHLFLTHDTGRAGRYAVHQGLADVGTNVVIGHTHRTSYIIEGNAEGKAHVGASFGWLGDVEKADYMMRIRALRDWALGFGIGYYEQETGNVYLQPVPIVEYKCVVEGKMISVDP